jgi:hypothetical protein
VFKFGRSAKRLTLLTEPLIVNRMEGFRLRAFRSVGA